MVEVPVRRRERLGETEEGRQGGPGWVMDDVGDEQGEMK